MTQAAAGRAGAPPRWRLPARRPTAGAWSSSARWRRGGDREPHAQRPRRRQPAAGPPLAGRRPHRARRPRRRLPGPTLAGRRRAGGRPLPARGTARSSPPRRTGPTGVPSSTWASARPNGCTCCSTRSTTSRRCRRSRVSTCGEAGAATTTRSSTSTGPRSPFWRLDRAGLDEALTATSTVHFQVARSHDRIVGYSVCGRAGHRGYVQRLAVDLLGPGPRRRRGPADRRPALVAAVGRSRLALVNTQEGNARSLRLYQRSGFVLQPEGLAVLHLDLTPHAPGQAPAPAGTVAAGSGAAGAHPSRTGRNEGRPDRPGHQPGGPAGGRAGERPPRWSWRWWSRRVGPAAALPRPGSAGAGGASAAVAPTIELVRQPAYVGPASHTASRSG